MFCTNCGKQTDDNARFCPECGAKTGKADMGAAAVPSAHTARQPAQAPPIQGQRVTENIYLCPDGVYRWAYEYKLMRNPTILITIFKVMVLSVGIAAALVLMIDLFTGLFTGDFDAELFVSVITTFLIALPFILLLSFIGYVIYAAMSGWKYCVMFEMDENGITHTQFDKSLELGELMKRISVIAASIGIVSQAVSAGLLIRTSMRTEFDRVTKIKAKKNRKTIYLNAGLYHNQVYAGAADFDFVLGYIKERLPAEAAGR